MKYNVKMWEEMENVEKIMSEKNIVVGKENNFIKVIDREVECKEIEEIETLAVKMENFIMIHEYKNKLNLIGVLHEQLRKIDLHAKKTEQQNENVRLFLEDAKSENREKDMELLHLKKINGEMSN